MVDIFFMTDELKVKVATFENEVVYQALIPRLKEVAEANGFKGIREEIV